MLVVEEIKKEASGSALSDSQNNLRVDKYPSASEINIKDLMGLVNSDYRKHLPQNIRITAPVEAKTGAAIILLNV